MNKTDYDYEDSDNVSDSDSKQQPFSPSTVHKLTSPKMWTDLL